MAKAKKPVKRSSGNMSPLTPASSRLVGSRRLSQSAIDIGAVLDAAAIVWAFPEAAAALSFATVLGSRERRARNIGVRNIANSPAASNMLKNNKNVRMPSLPIDVAPALLIVASRCEMTSGRTVSCRAETHRLPTG